MVALGTVSAAYCCRACTMAFPTMLRAEGHFDSAHPRIPKAPARRREAHDLVTSWSWPRWVPNQVRSEIEGFWSRQNISGASDYARDALLLPVIGTRVRLPIQGRSRRPGKKYLVGGRLVHAWGRSGRIITVRGTIYAVTYDGGDALSWRRSRTPRGPRRS